jgi:hypothetical protein
MGNILPLAFAMKKWFNRKEHKERKRKVRADPLRPLRLINIKEQSVAAQVCDTTMFNNDLYLTRAEKEIFITQATMCYDLPFPFSFFFSSNSSSTILFSIRLSGIKHMIATTAYKARLIHWLIKLKPTAAA